MVSPDRLQALSPGVSPRVAAGPPARRPFLPLSRARSARCAHQRPRQGRHVALHAATWKTAAISNVAVAFRRILGTAALVLRIQIDVICEITPLVNSAAWRAQSSS